MATVRTIEAPAGLSGARERVLSPDGRLVACRCDGEHAGLYLFEVGGQARPLRLDHGCRHYHAPAWSDAGDVLFRVERDGLPSQVGVVPAFGRGSPTEFDGAGIAVSGDGRVLAVADPMNRALRVAVAQPGNSPFHLPQSTIGELREVDPTLPVAMELTRDGAWVVLVRHSGAHSPSLWSYPVAAGDAQELASAVAAPGLLSFALSRGQLAVLEVRMGREASARLYVKPLAAGSLGALMLGPASDLLYLRRTLPPQRPAFSPDGKRIAIVGSSVSDDDRLLVEVLPASGARSPRLGEAVPHRGCARFLASGEIVVDGMDRVSVVTL